MIEVRFVSVKEEFTIETAKEIIDYALTKFYLYDTALVQYPSIKEAVSENCMLFRIGLYIHEFIQQNHCFELLNVDCQYNRNFYHPKTMYKQTLSGVNEKIKDPIPDLLFHQRGNNDNNLFLIELKKGKPKESELSKDVEKLCYFTNESYEYKYKYGFSIWLYKRNWAKVKVYSNGKERSHLNYVWKVK